MNYNEISVSTSELHDIANKVATSFAMLEENYKKIVTLNENLEEYWTGEAATAFRNEFSTFTNHFSACKKKVSEVENHLRDSVTKYEETELANKIKI